MQIHRIQAFILACLLPVQGNLAAENEDTPSNGTGPGVTNRIARWRAAAERGEAWACFNFGLAYHVGEGIEKNEAEAAKWYRAAAERGYAAGQANLGYCYETGIGVPVDYSEAVKWYQMAAVQGHPYAQYNLGKRYQNGPGVPIDSKLAERWFKQAAQRNFVPAYFSLGQMYANDTSDTPDYREAYRWFKLAADQSYAPAQHAIGYLYFAGLGVQTNYFEAVKWFDRAASRNFPDSHYNLAICYERGLGVPQNLVAAVTHYRTAAEFGHAFAQYSLGVSYYEGKGVESDYVQAYKWWNLSAVQGVPEAASSREILSRLMPESKVQEAQRMAGEFVVRQATNGEIPRLVLTASTDASEVRKVGTGFLISPDGFMLSTYRAIAGTTNIQVITEGGTFNASIVKTDSLNDIALLKVPGAFQPLPLTLTRDTILDSDVLALGFDGQNQGQFTPKAARGKIAGLQGYQSDPRQLSVDPRVTPSFGGCAVVNRHGQVIGMILTDLETTLPAEARQNVPLTNSFALKSDHLLGFLRTVPGVRPVSEEPKTGDELTMDEVQSKARAATALILAL